MQEQAVAAAASPASVTQPLSDALLACAFDAWYPHFRDCTFESVVIPLPGEFIEYLHRDGVILPPNLVPARAPRTMDDYDYGSDDDDDDGDAPAEWVGDHFLELQQRIRESLDALGGRAFVKLNWSAPLDAAFMTGDGSVCARSVADVFLLLKSSDFVAHDLDLRCDRYVLVLRRWFDLRRSGEFRCFVRGGRLVAISQRDLSAHYDFLPERMPDVRAAIQVAFTDRIRPRFPASDFVFDVYVDGRNRVWLVDFAPFAVETDPLLFDWSDAPLARESVVDGGAGSDTSAASDAPAIRLVERGHERSLGVEGLSHMPLEVAMMGQWPAGTDEER